MEKYSNPIICKNAPTSYREWDPTDPAMAEVGKKAMRAEEVGTLSALDDDDPEALAAQLREEFSKAPEMLAF